MICLYVMGFGVMDCLLIIILLFELMVHLLAGLVISTIMLKSKKNYIKII